jgi:hypothetical protein
VEPHRSLNSVVTEHHTVPLGVLVVSPDHRELRSGRVELQAEDAVAAMFRRNAVMRVV